MAKWGEMTDAYMEMVPEPRPARTCVEVSKLPLNAEVSNIVSSADMIITLA